VFAFSTVLLLAGLAARAALVAGFVPFLVLNAPPEGLAGVLFPVWVTPFTSTLVHDSFLPLAINLVILAIAGRLIERPLGRWGVVALYVLGAYVAAAAEWAAWPDMPIPITGASGATSAVLGASAILFSRMQVRAIGPLSKRLIEALWLGVAWTVLQALPALAYGLSMTGVLQQIAGNVAGFVLGMILVRPLLLWRYRGA